MWTPGRLVIISDKERKRGKHLAVSLYSTLYLILSYFYSMRIMPISYFSETPDETLVTSSFLMPLFYIMITVVCVFCSVSPLARQQQRSWRALTSNMVSCLLPTLRLSPKMSVTNSPLGLNGHLAAALLLPVSG